MVCFFIYQTCFSLRRCCSHLTPRRSPLLACICGACRALRSCATTYVAVFYGVGTDKNSARAVSALITVPALWVGNGALIAWVVRLLVLYDPRKRTTWGRFVRERSVARALCWTFAGMEAAFWITASCGDWGRQVADAQSVDELHRAQLSYMYTFDVRQLFH